MIPPAATAAKSLQSCLTLFNPIDGSPPGSLIPGILQARVLEWGAIGEPNKNHSCPTAQQRFSFKMWAVGSVLEFWVGLAPWSPETPTWIKFHCPFQTPAFPSSVPYIFSSAPVAARASWFFLKLWEKAACSGIKRSSLSSSPWLAASPRVSGCSSTFLHEKPELMDRNPLVYHVDWWLHPSRVHLWEERVKVLLMGFQLWAGQDKYWKLFSEAEAWFTSKTKKLGTERSGVWFELSL